MRSRKGVVMSTGGFLTPLRVFIACPGDVTEEKTRVIEVIRELEIDARERGFDLSCEEWGQCLGDMGRPQQVIFDQLKPGSWDLVICILWSRFGMPSGAVN